MATVTGLTAARMLAIEAASIVDGDVVGDDLILTKHSGATINAGNVRGQQGIQGIEGPSGGSAGWLRFSDMAGADDDAKLATAVSTVAAMTYKPTVILDENRLYTFNNAHPDPPHGWHLSGPIGGLAANPEQSSKNSLNAKVKINFSGTWCNLTVEKWNIKFSNINFEGTSNTTWLNSTIDTLWCAHFSDLAFNLFKNVIGTPTNHCLMTGCWIDGAWDVANSYATAFTLCGSDNNLFMDGMYIDSGITSGVVDGTPHIKFDWLAKSVIGPIYSTSRNNWTGLHVVGSTDRPVVMLPGSRWEGKNEGTTEPNAPCRGATIRVDSGFLTIYGASINFGMIATNGRSDAGVVHHAGGFLLMHDCNYARANGVSQDVPFVYSSGGKLWIDGVQPNTQGGNTWTDVPLVQIAGTSNLMHSDSSVRVTPQKEKMVRVFSDTLAPTNPQVGDLHFA